MKSVRNALAVFEEVAARQPVGLSELSRSLGVPKASVQRALATLRDAGWLRYDLGRPGHWVVTAHFSVLADVDPDVIRVRDAARPYLGQLREAVDGTVGLFVLDGDRMVLLAGPDDGRTVQSVEAALGPLPVHLSAAGRAILAHLGEETRTELLERVLGADAGNHGIARRVEAEMERSRTEGYAIAAGEYRDDLGAVAAAILDPNGAPVAAVVAMVPLGRLTREGTAQLGAAVVGAASGIACSAGEATLHR